MRAAISGHHFGTVFRLARQAGISCSKIAAECDIKPERVGTLARGRGRVTRFDKIVRISDALRIPGHILGLADRPCEVSGPPATPARMTTTQKDGSHVRRRHFLQTASGAGLAVGMSDLTRPVAGQRIGEDFPAALRQRTARLRRLDDVLGDGDTYRVYVGEYQATKALLRDSSYSQATGRDLLSVLAEQACKPGGPGSKAAGKPTRSASTSHAAATQADDRTSPGTLSHSSPTRRLGPIAKVGQESWSARAAVWSDQPRDRVRRPDRNASRCSVTHCST